MNLKKLTINDIQKFVALVNEEDFPKLFGPDKFKISFRNEPRDISSAGLTLRIDSKIGGEDVYSFFLLPTIAISDRSMRLATLYKAVQNLTREAQRQKGK